MPAIESTTVATIKLTMLASVFGFFEYFGIPKEPFTLLGVLMMIDMCTGLAKQFAIDPKGITSHRWWLGLMKKIFTLVGILSIAICIKGMGFSANTFMTLTLSAFITAETYSIIQNWYIMRTGKFLPEFDATALVIKAISEFMKRQLQANTEALAKSPIYVPAQDEESKK